MIKPAFIAAAICTVTTAAQAVPIAPVTPDTAPKIIQVRWLCGPYRACWWQPDGTGIGYCWYPRPNYSEWRYRERYRR